MTRNTIALAATSGLVGLAVLAGSLAGASTTGDFGSAAEQRRFLAAHPETAADDDGGGTWVDDK